MQSTYTLTHQAAETLRVTLETRFGGVSHLPLLACLVADLVEIPLLNRLNRAGLVLMSLEGFLRRRRATAEFQLASTVRLMVLDLLHERWAA